MLELVFIALGAVLFSRSAVRAVSRLPVVVGATAKPDIEAISRADGLSVSDTLLASELTRVLLLDDKSSPSWLLVVIVFVRVGVSTFEALFAMAPPPAPTRSLWPPPSSPPTSAALPLSSRSSTCSTTSRAPSAV